MRFPIDYYKDDKSDDSAYKRCYPVVLSSKFGSNAASINFYETYKEIFGAMLYASTVNYDEHMLEMLKLPTGTIIKGETAFSEKEYVKLKDKYIVLRTRVADNAVVYQVTNKVPMLSSIEALNTALKTHQIEIVLHCNASCFIWVKTATGVVKKFQIVWANVIMFYVGTPKGASEEVINKMLETMNTEL